MATRSETTRRSVRPAATAAGARPAPGRPAPGRPAPGRPARPGAGRRGVSAAVRRRIAGIVLLVVVGGLGFVLGGLGGGSADAATGEEIVVVVSPGETVWDLAMPHAPAGVDPRIYVTEVIAHNDLDPTRLQPGTVLRLPSR